MNEQWGPWIEHDGNGCPCIGEFVEAIDETHSGKQEMTRCVAGSGGAFSWDWQWSKKQIPGFGACATRIIRYRVRKPKGLTILEHIAQNVPQEVGA